MIGSHRRRPSRYPRAQWTRLHARMSLRIPTVADCSNGLARGSGIKVNRSRGQLICNLVASLLDSTTAAARRHRADTCASRALRCRAPGRPSASARAKWRGSPRLPAHRFRTVPPAPLAGLVSFPPAPFAAALSFADFAGCSRSFRRPQTAETGTDSGAPKAANQHRARCSAYRPRPAIGPRGFARPGPPQ